MQGMVLVIFAALLLLPPGCGHISTTKTCDWARAIRPTSNDVDVMSDKLAEQLLVHNTTGSRVCGWKQ